MENEQGERHQEMWVGREVLGTCGGKSMCQGVMPRGMGNEDSSIWVEDRLQSGRCRGR